MASSSASDQLDLEKGSTSPGPVSTHAAAPCPGTGSKKDCEGWAAGQDALAPVCSRIGSHVQDDRSDNDEDSRHDDDDDGAPAGGDSVVGRVLSRITSKSSVDLGPPPDGGCVAWTQCLITHLIIFTTWGWANSFGSFQAYYTTLLDRSPSEVSWIGSLNVFLLFFVGTFTGRLTDAGHFRAVFLVGSVLLAVGIFATAQCTTYVQLLLAQGVCIGIAHGCLFCPTLAVLSTYFHRRRALALGIAACGSATGGLVFPSMVRQLLPRVGFPWTVRAIGFVQIAVIAVANLGIRTRIRPRKTGPIVEWPAFQELEYTFYAAAAFFNFWGVYFAFFYISAYSRDSLNPPLSYPDSLNLLLILNGVGIIGRIVPNFIADRIGAVNVFIPTSIIASILVFCFITIDRPAGLYAWVVIYGIVGAGIQSLFPAALSFLTTDLRKLGVRMGMVFTIVSFAVLTGPPIAGAIIASPAGYTGAKAFAGSSMAVGCGFLIAAKLARMHSKGLGWNSRI
ncbi:Major facilitator superfamily general substrate transporter [Cordyceps militaris]|uniref:Major facilitator superfamily general substrate transporter n=1 Tax=Cordyceps militaris TaxID=73501 RepID=A0A2H4SNR1_CORMI|nr:Major facilitator superfamily general substrate transporter [Cordyceps militaris]